MQRPLATVVIGGILSSTALTCWYCRSSIAWRTARTKPRDVERTGEMAPRSA
ncbi:hypothetical protein LA354_16150 [Ralstonia pickettii]|uniref:hypothetical protein n=1 Tax=Ralstonia pickettii TaxID=329 RepID=UPI001CE364E6|nr:hypothetical protein [Ralstonia pickettii]UCA14423.1 hypothetical protein LA354_16150 [Ralstonia pickettii]